MRESIEKFWLKLIRLYTFHSPVRKGKYRLYQTALGLCRFPPTEIEAVTTDGRHLSVDLTSGMHEMVFFLGEYERAVTNLMKAVVKPGDVCLDVGANFGWYTTLLHRLCSQPSNGNGARRGAVHAFEPQPDIFEELTRNLALAGNPANIFLNNFAVGDENKTAEFHRFADLPSGHSSLSDMGRTDFEVYTVEVKTLDSYLEQHRIDNVNFLKVDIEGAELMFLKGATRLFRQTVAPLMMMEMAQPTTQGFGYLPNDILEFLSAHAPYKFFWLDDVRETLREFKKFEPGELGAHVLCVPENCQPERLEKLKIVG